MDNSSSKKPVLILCIVIALILVVGAVYFFGIRPRTERSTPPDQDLSGAGTQELAEDSQAVLPSPPPVVPQTNPFEEAKTNPFKDIKTNPFE